MRFMGKKRSRSWLRKKHDLQKFLLFASVIPLILLGYFVSYQNKTLPNTYFASQQISGRDREETAKIISAIIDDFEKRGLTLEVGDQVESFKLSDLGIEINKHKTLEKVFASKHSNYLGSTLLIWLRAPFLKTFIGPQYSVNYYQLGKITENSLAKYEKPVKNASIILEGNEAKIADAQSGSVVDKSALLSSLYQSIDSLSPRKIKTLFIEESPLTSHDQAVRALDKVKNLEQRQIVLNFGFDRWRIAGSDLFDFLKFYPYGYEDNYVLALNFGKSPIAVTELEYGNDTKPPLEVSLDRDKIDKYISQIGAGVDKPTIDATLRFENGKVVQFSPAQDGQKLDTALTKQLILDKISIDDISFEKEITINLPVKVSRAAIASSEINSLGIRELVGRGVSYFAGSIANRIYNIGLGASLINGTLVKPGDNFSFDKLVGPVSAEQGFKQAYVIQKGRTVLDDGGGICQVSTTVFRAALNAGLPIVARTAHAYRVGYYEQRGFKPGFDATIWSPSVDFQFKNDTDHSVLVQAVVDRANAKLQVDIYGTSDGRKVEISDAVVSNISAPPAVKYQDEPTLPKGTVKQVDFEAWGATSVFSRKVYKGDQKIIDEVFKSYFKPWQAVYLVGTGG